MVTTDPPFFNNHTDDMPAIRLSIYVKERTVPVFFQLLEHGFYLNVQTGCSVKELLCKQFGIPEDYVAQRIKSIFVDAKVVDDLNLATVKDGSRLALSGAMPGLVGAVLRSGGFYAPMRSQISYDQAGPAALRGAGRITLKLLNLVLKELGPQFLEQGIWYDGKGLQEFIRRHLNALESDGAAAELNGKSVNLESALQRDWTDCLVLVRIRSDRNA